MDVMVFDHGCGEGTYFRPTKGQPRSECVKAALLRLTSFASSVRSRTRILAEGLDGGGTHIAISCL